MSLLSSMDNFLYDALFLKKVLIILRYSTKQDILWLGVQHPIKKLHCCVRRAYLLNWLCFVRQNQLQANLHIIITSPIVMGTFRELTKGKDAKAVRFVLIHHFITYLRKHHGANVVAQDSTRQKVD